MRFGYKLACLRPFFMCGYPPTYPAGTLPIDIVPTNNGAGVEGQIPPIRKRGRPPGSTNKTNQKTFMAPSADVPPAVAAGLGGLPPHPPPPGFPALSDLGGIVSGGERDPSRPKRGRPSLPGRAMQGMTLIEEVKLTSEVGLDAEGRALPSPLSATLNHVPHPPHPDVPHVPHPPHPDVPHVLRSWSKCCDRPLT